MKLLKPVTVGVLSWVVLNSWCVGLGGRVLPEVLLSAMTSGLGLVLAPWAILAGWSAACGPRTICRRAAIPALVFSVTGATVLAYHIDMPRSPLCLVEWLGLPGWPLGAGVAAGLDLLGASSTVALWGLGLSVAMSPWLWFEIVSWLARHFNIVRRCVLFLPAPMKALDHGAA
jgi:hypothetical protein